MSLRIKNLCLKSFAPILSIFIVYMCGSGSTTLRWSLKRRGGRQDKGKAFFVEKKHKTEKILRIIYDAPALHVFQTNSYLKSVSFPAVFRIRIQLNPDPAKNLNRDPEPEDLESGSGSKLFLNTLWNFFLNYSKIIRFSYQNKSIEK